VKVDKPHHASTNGAGGAAPSPTTAIAVILDETGSMGSCRDTAISGFNEWLVSQQQVGEPCVLTLTKFSSRPKVPMCRVVCDGAPIRDVKPLDHGNYQPDGNTPLYDAIGQTLTALDRLSPQPDRLLVVILTDGEENASREYSLPQIQEMIRAREATGRWTFVYLGADQDAWAASQRIGAHSANAASFGKRDMKAAFRTMSEATSAYRSRKELRSRDFWESGRPPSEPGASGKAAQDEPQG
jgi:hypothetical protein